MTKVDIFSGFLGAGKTTLIKKLIAEAYTGEKLVLIENEFGDVGIDGGFMAEAGIEVSEMNSGCICCSLVGDFRKALGQVVEQFAPDRILIEPSGVGKLSDILRAVAAVDGLAISSAVAVADAGKCRMYLKNFGEFYADQIRHAGAIVLSRTGGMSQDKLAAAVALLREQNPDAVIITTPWEALSGEAIARAIAGGDTLARELEELEQEQHHHHDHDEDECDDPDCACHHHHDHDDDEDEHEHEHHHHDHDEDEDDHEHHHHHHDHDEDECDDPDCECHHHHDHDHEHHHHHHGHDADEVFVSWGVETPKKFTEAEVRAILAALDDEARFGAVLRAKGIVDAADGDRWLHFDHVPGEADVRRGPAGVTGRLCVIGSGLKEDALKELFGV
ncbi:MAG: CobW family GTP-binding protein [Oscillospiraceae bacterium]